MRAALTQGAVVGADFGEVEFPRHTAAGNAGRAAQAEHGPPAARCPKSGW